MRFDEIRVGASAAFDAVLDEGQIDAFARLSGDLAPLHMDSGFARSRGFNDRVAHGFLIGAYVSRLIGMHLPGESAVILSETLRFHEPVYPGRTLQVSGRVESVSEATSTIDVAVQVTCEARLHVSGTVRALVRS